MGKQVSIKDRALYVQTRLLETDRDSFNKVIITCKGEQAQTFYKYPEQAFNDPDYLNTLFIMGYRVSDLVIVAERLRAGGVDIMRLKDYNQAFIDGYQRAQADFNKAMQECIKNTVDSFNNLDVK